MRSWWAPFSLPLVLAGLVVAAALGACQRDAAGPGARVAAVPPTGARMPADAVLLLTRHLRENDLPAFARDAVPPDLHRQLEAAWRAGRTRWPLDELPFDERLPRLLGALAEPGSERRLQAVFDRQFAGETSALRAAATALGLFGAQYVQHQGDFSAAERAHYLQFVDALSRWGREAPLGDPARARTAIPRLTTAARATGLRTEADFARLGMTASLQRLSGFLRTLKELLDSYGLPLDQTLGALRAETVSQDGARAKVRMRYVLGGRPVEAVVEVERVAGRWYLSDYLRHARAAVAGAATARSGAVAASGPRSTGAGREGGPQAND
jgi:hypothetical protein